MKSIIDIQDRIDSFQCRLNLLNDKYQQQLERHQSKRDQTLMKFLLEERSIYQLALTQLMWVLESGVSNNDLHISALTRAVNKNTPPNE